MAAVGFLHAAGGGLDGIHASAGQNLQKRLRLHAFWQVIAVRSVSQLDWVHGSG